jgi:hypothetical protein
LFLLPTASFDFFHIGQASEADALASAKPTATESDASASLYIFSALATQPSLDQRRFSLPKCYSLFKRLRFFLCYSVKYFDE